MILRAPLVTPFHIESRFPEASLITILSSLSDLNALLFIERHPQILRSASGKLHELHFPEVDLGTF